MDEVMQDKSDWMGLGLMVGIIGLLNFVVASSYRPDLDPIRKRQDEALEKFGPPRFNPAKRRSK